MGIFSAGICKQRRLSLRCFHLPPPHRLYLCIDTATWPNIKPGLPTLSGHASCAHSYWYLRRVIINDMFIPDHYGSHAAPVFFSQYDSDRLQSKPDVGCWLINGGHSFWWLIGFGLLFSLFCWVCLAFTLQAVFLRRKSIYRTLPHYPVSSSPVLVVEITRCSEWQRVSTEAADWLLVCRVKRES